MATPAATPGLGAALPAAGLDEAPPEPPVAVGLAEAEDEVVTPARVVSLPHCSSRALVHWNCALESEPVRLMQMGNHSKQTWAGTVCW